MKTAIHTKREEFNMYTLMASKSSKTTETKESKETIQGNKEAKGTTQVTKDLIFYSFLRGSDSVTLSKVCEK